MKGLEKKTDRKQKEESSFCYRAAEVVMVLLLFGYISCICRAGNQKDVEISVIADHMRNKCSLEGMKQGDANTLKQYFSLDASAYDGCMVSTSDSAMDVDELLIVKLKDKSQLDSLEASVNARLEKQIKSFHGYGTNQEDLLGNAVIWKQGKYFFYAVSDQAQQWEDVFLTCIR